MTQYDFHTLSPADFEELNRDLLSRFLNLSIESFTTGRDSGIDLRCALVENRTIIIQCKHYAKSGFEALLSNVRQTELPKIQSLKPLRYILATSVPMTPARKYKLFEALSPFCQQPGDILGREDLNALLRDYPEVEKTHFKLWLTGTAVLDKVLNETQFTQASLERASIEKRLSIYVRTKAFDEAMQRLKDYNYCIISGNPGIGKTTLAEILIVHLLEQKYELRVARQTLEEALQIIGRNTVIYYDDFLGQSALGDFLEKNEEHSILRLLDTALQGTQAKLILTTREHVLQQGLQRYERLNNPEFLIGKCIVDLRKYNRSHRAQILYNHLFYNGVPELHIESILGNRKYQQIVDHPKYSPRIIEWMTSQLTIKTTQAQEYGSLFLDSLNNPAKIWQHAFESHISQEARQLLLCMATLPPIAPLEALERCWWTTFEQSGFDALPGELRLKLKKALKEIDGSFVRTSTEKTTIAVTFHDASISDFVLQHIGSSDELVLQLANKCLYFEQVHKLIHLSSSGRLKPEATTRLPPKVVIEALERSISKDSVYLLGSSNSGYVLYRRSYAERLADVFLWSIERDDAALRNFAIAQLECSLDQDRFSKASLDDLADLLNILLQSTRSQINTVTSAILPLRDRITEDLQYTGRIDQWKAWGRCVKAWHSVLEVSQQEWRDRAHAFCTEEKDVILNNMETADDIQYSASELQRVAEVWDIDVSEIVSSLEEASHKRPQRQPSSVTWDRTEQSEMDVSNEDLDQFFGSLRA